MNREIGYAGYAIFTLGLIGVYYCFLLSSDWLYDHFRIKIILLFLPFFVTGLLLIF